MALREKSIEKLLVLAAFLSALVTFSIFVFLFVLGFPLFAEGRFFSIMTEPWAPYLGEFGIYPMIVGTLVISLVTMVLAVPLSLGCALLISVVDSGRIGGLLRRTVQTMTGVPTVIYGFVGIFLLVPLVREMYDTGSGMCILSAALMMTLLVSPTMILFFCDSFERVPRAYGNAVLALGGTEIQKFLHVTLPHAWPCMLVGVTLAFGRAVGDTLIALMLAGNAVQVPGSLLDSARTLTAHIALVFAADYESMEFKAIFACGLFLYGFTTLLVLVTRYLASRRSGARW